jgi:hypothetical protein
MTSLSAPAMSREPRALAVMSAGVAVAAGAGAIALFLGATDFGSELDARLPFDSPAFAGFALLVVVALPMSAVAVLASQRDHRAPIAAFIAGALLIGWIAVQLVVLRSFSWLQPLCAAIGAAVIILAVVAHISPRSRS